MRAVDEDRSGGSCRLRRRKLQVGVLWQSMAGNVDGWRDWWQISAAEGLF